MSTASVAYAQRFYDNSASFVGGGKVSAWGMTGTNDTPIIKVGLKFDFNSDYEQSPYYSEYTNFSSGNYYDMQRYYMTVNAVTYGKSHHYYINAEDQGFSMLNLKFTN